MLHEIEQDDVKLFTFTPTWFVCDKKVRCSISLDSVDSFAGNSSKVIDNLLCFSALHAYSKKIYWFYQIFLDDVFSFAGGSFPSNPTDFIADMIGLTIAFTCRTSEINVIPIL
jgi:hypothetical protein